MYSGRQKKFDDETLRSYCASSENCLRTPILSAIGEHIDSHFRIVPASMCCLVCSGGHIPVERLDVMKIGKAKSNKRKRPKSGMSVVQWKAKSRRH